MAGKRKDNKGRVLKDGESQRTDGRYMYRWTVNGKRNTIYASSLGELRQKEQAVARNLFDGIDTDGGNITLNGLFYSNMELKSGRIRKTTEQNYLALWKNNVEQSMIGNMSIASIKQVHIKAFYKEKQSSGLKKSTIKLLHTMIYATLEMAVENDYVRKNVSRNAMADIKTDAREKEPLTEEEFENVIDFCNKGIYSIYSSFLIIAVGTCMRGGEISGLTWNDVDMKKRTISINHQLIYKNYGDGCKFHISEPKTEAGKRIIPMTENVYQAFVAIKKLNLALGYRCKAEVDGYRDFIFFSKNGHPFALNAINAFLSNIEKAYNKRSPDDKIPHLSAHVLRHTGCTIYATKGMDIKALQDFMGHSDAAITLNVYNHSSFERTEKELQRIERIANCQ